MDPKRIGYVPSNGVSHYTRTTTRTRIGYWSKLKLPTHSGTEFNEKYAGIKFYKLTNITECHRQVQFSTGKIKDPNPLDCYNTCAEGGIYFCEEKNISAWIECASNALAHYIRPVTIPPEATVCVEDNKFKTDVIEIGV
jgi:hypothetical protein